jgi:hypothetical protein
MVDDGLRDGEVVFVSTEEDKEVSDTQELPFDK